MNPIPPVTKLKLSRQSDMKLDTKCCNLTSNKTVILFRAGVFN